MFVVMITEKGGKASRREFDQAEVTIGRIEGNDLVLPKSNISKRHARIIAKNDSYVVVDSKSTNGTYINGKRIDAPYDLQTGDKIFVGDFTLEIESARNKRGKKRPSVPPPPPPQEDELVASSEVSDADYLESADWKDPESQDEWSSEWGQPEADASSELEALEREALARVGLDSDVGLENRTQQLSRDQAKPKHRAPETIPQSRSANSGRPVSLVNESQVLEHIHHQLLRRMADDRVHRSLVGDTDLRVLTQTAVESIVDRLSEAGELPINLKADRLIDEILSETTGLGPLNPLLQERGVTQVLVNGPDQVFVERDGRLERTEISFSSELALLGFVQRLLAPTGQCLDERTPVVEARLRDGIRVHAVAAPIALNGPMVTLQKPKSVTLQLEGLVTEHVLTGGMAQFLRGCVRAARNIVISGGASAGKTSLLNVLASNIPLQERIITVESIAELSLDQPHVVRLECRPPGPGEHGFTCAELIQHALRMRPDRLVVGECRDREALSLLQALNLGHRGVLTTIHSRDPLDALERLVSMASMTERALPKEALLRQMADGIDLVVHRDLGPDGIRRITQISEVDVVDGDAIAVHDIFVYEASPTGTGGQFKATGKVPTFLESLRDAKVEMPSTMFLEGSAAAH